ncbi:MAG: hypothetical protein ACJAYX_004546 [Planctomycetota bacterium]|jgi:hypothetical protein
MSDLADCYAGTVVRPDGLCFADIRKHVFGPGHRSRFSARTSHHSLVIDESELANSTKYGLGSISG